MKKEELNSLYDFYKSRCVKYLPQMLFDSRITYGDAWVYAAARAAFLQQQGYKKGTVIGLLAPNSSEWCITYMAITMIGGIVLPLDANLPLTAYPQMLKEVKCTTVFISDEYKTRLKKVKLFSVDLNKSTDYNTKMKPVQMNRDDIASYVFTSATPRKSKIVMLSQANIFATAIGLGEFEGFKPGELSLCVLPLFHVYALCTNFTAPFACGGAIVFQPSLEEVDIKKSLAENPITCFSAVPQLWKLFMDNVLNKVKSESLIKYKIFTFFLNYSHVFRAIGLKFIPGIVFKPVHRMFGLSQRFFISGGTSLEKQYVKYYKNMGFTLVESYGLAETAGLITLPHYKKNISGSVGTPIANNSIKIKRMNEHGIGEIWLRGDSVMLGYYKNDAANKTAFDEARFFNTGDFGKLDVKKNLYITERSKVEKFL